MKDGFLTLTTAFRIEPFFKEGDTRGVWPMFTRAGTVSSVLDIPKLGYVLSIEKTSEC